MSTSADRHAAASVVASAPAAEMSDSANALERLHHSLYIPEGKMIYAKRKTSVEPEFGVLKLAMRFRQFLLRGLEGASGEWNILSMAFNLKRMHVLAQAG